MASSYKFCVIANGEYDIYAARERANEWDYAAGHAIAQNAGAIIKTLDESVEATTVIKNKHEATSNEVRYFNHEHSELHIDFCAHLHIYSVIKDMCDLTYLGFIFS